MRAAQNESLDTLMKIPHLLSGLLRMLKRLLQYSALLLFLLQPLVDGLALVLQDGGEPIHCDCCAEEKDILIGDEKSFEIDGPRIQQRVKSIEAGSRPGESIHHRQGEDRKAAEIEGGPLQENGMMQGPS
jgi:hypothetical protein